MMKHPDFFDEIEHIRVQDNLAQFLGAIDDGIIEFSYMDIVKVAGHSCLIVAGAYLAALKGLSALYGEEIPKRGEIKIEIRKKPTDDNAGVVGSVLSNITGAATNYGFGGLTEGKFRRRDLLVYNAFINEDIRFTRLDSGKQIGINYRPDKVVDPSQALKKMMGPDATAEDKKEFPEHFQNMVKTIFEKADVVLEIVSN